MKYFAKCVPIEGDIKVGDFVLDVAINTYVKMSQEAESHKIPQLNQLKEEYKKCNSSFFQEMKSKLATQCGLLHRVKKWKLKACHGIQIRANPYP